MAVVNSKHVGMRQPLLATDSCSEIASLLNAIYV